MIPRHEAKGHNTVYCPWTCKIEDVTKVERNKVVCNGCLREGYSCPVCGSTDNKPMGVIEGSPSIGQGFCEHQALRWCECGVVWFQDPKTDEWKLVCKLEGGAVDG